jgi:predicted 2-oxoglutarate/Fe(II)-dependent dioxygenase YbiX
MMPSMTRDLLQKVLVQHQAVEPGDLHRLQSAMAGLTPEPGTVFDAAASNRTGRTVLAVNKAVRDVQQLSVGPVRDVIDRINQRCIDHFVAPFYGVRVHGVEKPQLLSYAVDGHYRPHVDGEAQWRQPDGQVIWRKTRPRDLSMVYFLNDDFSGGELVFPGLDLVVKPQTGTLVCFPSTHDYLHGVLPVRAGHRYSLVTWLNTG